MNGEFVTKLQEIIAQSQDNERLMPDQAIVVPETYRMEDLERFQDHRRRFRGTFKTSHIDSFVRYCQPELDECFVSQEAMSAVAFYNMGTAKEPGHCDHKALLALEQTAEYKAFGDFAGGRPIAQRELAEFLEDWRTHIEAVDENDDVIPIAKVIQTVRNVTIDSSKSLTNEEQDFSAAKSVLEQIDAKSKDGAFPKYLTFGCMPYHGLRARELPFRLSIRTDGNAVKFALRIIRPEQIREELAEEFAEVLREKMEDQTILLGEFKP